MFGSWWQNIRQPLDLYRTFLHHDRGRNRRREIRASGQQPEGQRKEHAAFVWSRESFGKIHALLAFLREEGIESS